MLWKAAYFAVYLRSSIRSPRRGAEPRRLGRRSAYPPWRHRTFAGRQDDLHHRADRASDQGGKPGLARQEKYLAGFPGACRREANRRARSSRSPTTPCPASPMRITLPRLAGPEGNAEARHWPQSTRRISELRLRLYFDQTTGLRPGRQSLSHRYRRLSGRVAARFAASSEILRAMVARNLRCLGERGPGAARGAMARACRQHRSARRPPMKRRRAARPSFSPLICAPAAPTNIIFPACRRAVS